MRVTFAPSSNTSTNGVALSSNAEDDVRVYKLIVGTPVASGNIWLYTINNPVSSATTNIASKITLPSFSTTNINPGVYVVDFGAEGLPLNGGGALVIDQTMNVSVLWDLNDDSIS